MIRVLIAEDSPTLRCLIRNVLESDPDLQVVGTARNGEEAMALLRELHPDIMTTDILMPRMDGYELIRKVMAEAPLPIVVLTSTTSDMELGITFNAVEAGALMVVGKPSGLPGDDPEADRLISQVKAMARVKVVRRRHPVRRGSRAGERRRLARRWPIPRSVQLIGMGASTGGPPALQRILARLPSDLPVPIAVVQHISSGFVGGMARWLNDTTPLRVVVAEDRMHLRPATVYLAPDDHHMQVVEGGRIRLVDSPPVGGHRPSVTVLLESLARTHRASAVGVLLTGMGSDGANGLKALHDAGGTTIVQNEATCVVFGMPKQAVALGCVDEVLALDQIAGRLQELLSVHAGAGRTRNATSTGC